MGQRVTFLKETAHQILHVLRLSDDDQVAVLDNSGLIHYVRLRVDLSTNTVSGMILATQPVQSEPKTQLSLYFGLSSREKVEWILQKGTEVGVSAFYPFYSSRTLVKPASLSPKKLERWERIIKEAAEQSGRGRLPMLHAPKDLAGFYFDAVGFNDLCLLAYEGAGDDGLKLSDALDCFSGAKIGLFVGPEGGFSEGEVQAGLEAGCRVISLGKRILRMETAAMVLPALVLYVLDE
ncbi:MAG: 16S rRNA (uracil(1498)-N(3))-methyltransferase [Brevefilum sp.]|nr:16S rRNA (uracil(1498)-N(3))-methyltransferase [Brevefilum sp.]